MTLSRSSSPSQNETHLVEGCFCPEGTISYAPGFDICVDICGTPPTHTPPTLRPSLVLTPGPC